MPADDWCNFPMADFVFPVDSADATKLVMWAIAHATPTRQADCECPLDHSVTKLGHSRSCPHPRGPTMLEHVEVRPGCSPRHADGTPHDFDWATYADDRCSYGVCRCGHTSLDDAMWSGM